MKFLADMGVSDVTVTALRDGGHDIVHARDAGYYPMLDADIISRARIP